MSRTSKPKIVTANDLHLGDVVYFTDQRQWARSITDALVCHDADEAKALLEEATAQADQIVGAYLADVIVEEDGTVAPAHFREAFRMRGPSNYFHGKQAGA